MTCITDDVAASRVLAPEKKKTTQQQTIQRLIVRPTKKTTNFGEIRGVKKWGMERGGGIKVPHNEGGEGRFGQGLWSTFLDFQVGEICSKRCHRKASVTHAFPAQQGTVYIFGFEAY
jgi:hypothetical protein